MTSIFNDAEGNHENYLNSIEYFTYKVDWTKLLEKFPYTLLKF